MSTVFSCIHGLSVLQPYQFQLVLICLQNYDNHYVSTDFEFDQWELSSESEISQQKASSVHH